MPAYNASKTIQESYRKLPKNNIHEVILVDDASTDNTYAVAKKLPILVYRNAINLGYGGNLKVCLAKALERNADIVIEYHPDNQYDPKDLPLFIDKAIQGYDFALGSRFIHPKEALTNKMPLVKFIANRAMSFIDEFILGIELSEFHSGFRMYTRRMLESIPYKQNSDDYLFSFEVIVQAVFCGLTIAEVPISCKYHPYMHTANLKRSTIYALGTFTTLTQYVVSKFFNHPAGIFRDEQAHICPFCRDTIVRKEAHVVDSVSGKTFFVYFCTPCQMGFTDPAPKNLAPYYPQSYYSRLKSFIYTLLQFRRPALIRTYKKRGTLLDIGCGDGSLKHRLPEYTYVGIETPFARAMDPNIKLTGIEGMKEKASSYDVVTFWESLEHMRDPIAALKKAFGVVKKNGVVLIECPNFSSFERTLFGSRWFHLDPPRHLVHFTPQGLRHMLEKQGFRVLNQQQLYASEYTPVGLAQSMLYMFSPKLHLVAQQHKSVFRGIVVSGLLLFLLIFTIPLSLLLYFLHASPILLTVAKR